MKMVTKAVIKKAAALTAAKKYEQHNEHT